MSPPAATVREYPFGEDAVPRGIPAGRGALALVIAAGAVCIAALLFLFRDPLLRSVSLPLAWILWALRVAALAVGQRIVWALAVLAFAVLAVATLRSARTSRERSPVLPRGEGTRTRISFWERLLSTDSKSRAGRQVLVFELRRLVLSILEHTDGGDVRELEGRIEAGQIDLPAGIRELFAAPARTPPEKVDAAEIVLALEKRLGGTDRDPGRTR